MKLSKYQKVIYKVFQKTKKDINISAVAGSGKTTVLLGLLRFIPVNASSLFLAFNNSIVDELKDRNERKDVEIMTIHSCGWRLILQRYGGKVKMNPNKGIAKTEKVLREFEIPEKRRGYFFYVIPKILDLMRCNLSNNTVEDITELINHYDIDIDEDDIKMVIRAFELLVKDKSQFDFMDMIYVPVVDASIRFRKFEFVFCDESQDFSLAQHEFIKKCLSRKGRLVTVGDKRQAIYGFAGADAESYDKLATINGQAIKLPLSVSYRCDINIVKEAQKIVPEISYAPGASEGVVRNGSLTDIQQGDWILCRNLKPLVQAYLWLMKNKIKSKIRGKEIGEGILSLIIKTGAKTISGLEKMLDLERNKLMRKLESKGVRKPSLHPKMEVLQQKIEVINCLSGEVQSVDELKKLIKGIFSDEVKGIILSTIHKAKGLENDRIFFLAPELIPSKYATQPWQYEQEQNLFYVAVTRAKHELIYVWGNVFLEDIKGKVILSK
jgi:superfamily I DNA/RNA helicase